MKYTVYLYNQVNKCVFAQNLYTVVAGGNYSEHSYKRKIILELLQYWEKDIADTWKNISFVKQFEKMGLIPIRKYKCWTGIHFFFRRTIFLQFFKIATQKDINELYNNLNNFDFIYVVSEKDKNYTYMKNKYGTYNILSKTHYKTKCDRLELCFDCENLTHEDSNEYENIHNYNFSDIVIEKTECKCEILCV
jgi:hypothetical protein